MADSYTLSRCYHDNKSPRLISTTALEPLSLSVAITFLVRGPGPVYTAFSSWESPATITGDGITARGSKQDEK